MHASARAVNRTQWPKGLPALSRAPMTDGNTVLWLSNCPAHVDLGDRFFIKRLTCHDVLFLLFGLLWKLGAQRVESVGLVCGFIFVGYSLPEHQFG